MKSITIASLLFSLYSFGQKDGYYQSFDFLTLKPIDKVWLKRRGELSYKHEDSLIRVSYYGGIDRQDIVIYLQEAPFSSNKDSRCCSGDSYVSRRKYFKDSIVEYNYFYPNLMYTKEGEQDSIFLQTSRIITSDYVMVNYYNKEFVFDSIQWVTCPKIEKGIDSYSVKSWKKYSFKNGVNQREVVLTKSSEKDTQSGYLYFFPGFESGWWNERQSIFSSIYY